MSKSIPIVAILLLSALLLWLLLVWEPGPVGITGHQRLELAMPPRGSDFELVSNQGPVKLSDLKGRVVLLYFGYTACPDICPTNLAIIALALRQLEADELDRVQVLFVSVDPERDTPEQLADYVGYFHPRMIGLTGAAETIAAAAEQYGAAFQRSNQDGSAMGYMIDHSAFTYVIGPSGRLVDVLDHATPAEEIVATLRRYLTEDSSQT